MCLGFMSFHAPPTSLKQNLLHKYATNYNLHSGPILVHETSKLGSFQNKRPCFVLIIGMLFFLVFKSLITFHRYLHSMCVGYK